MYAGLGRGASDLLGFVKRGLFCKAFILLGREVDGGTGEAWQLLRQPEIFTKFAYRQPENAKPFGVLSIVLLRDRLIFRLPNPLQPNPSQLFHAAALSPSYSRTEHSFFGNKRALVRRHTKCD